MTLSKFEYIAAQSLGEAANLAAELGEKCMVMAGGTDVIPLLKDRAVKPDYIIDLKKIPGLDTLEYVPGQGLKVGALTKLRDIETSAVVKKELTAVADAAHYVASTQIRCKGTMAGNICNASPSADTAPILLALNARVKTVSPKDGSREIAITDFFKGVKKTSLGAGELVSEINIPELKSGEGAAYFKHAIRKAMDLAIIGVASWVKMDGKKIADCRIAVGGAAVTPFRAAAAEQTLIGKEYTDDLLEKAAAAAAGACKPISDVRASAEYRTDMVRVFTKRSFKKALETLKA
ncbi:MAG TPA: xanthine dehydrogenase family protein subunit M [Anaerovoracaceae bacterium]|nr:xanthine dehydrogenase family protein subunit M [Anaerovoracaceae bacterium]